MSKTAYSDALRLGVHLIASFPVSLLTEVRGVGRSGFLDESDVLDALVGECWRTTVISTFFLASSLESTILLKYSPLTNSLNSGRMLAPSSNFFFAYRSSSSFSDYSSNCTLSLSLRSAFLLRNLRAELLYFGGVACFFSVGVVASICICFCVNKKKYVVLINKFDTDQSIL